MNSRYRSLPRMWRRHQLRTGLLLLPAIAYLFIIYAAPFAKLFLLSFDFPDLSVRHYLEIASNQFLWGVLWNTLTLAAGVTVFCFLLGYPVAYLMVSVSPRLQHLIAILIILPVWTNLLVRTYAWIVILGRQGAVNMSLDMMGIISEPLPMLYNRGAVYVGMIHVMLPFMILPIFAVMRQLDLGLMKAARSLGASQFSALLWVFFPLTLPGVSAGCLLVFVLSLAFYVTPALLGGEADVTYVLVIDQEVNKLLNWPLASAMSVVLLLVTLLIVLLYQWLLGFGITGLSNSSSHGRGAWLLRGYTSCLAVLYRSYRMVFRSRRFGQRLMPQTVGNLLRHCLGWAVIIFVIIPILVVIPLAFTSTSFMVFPPDGFSFRWFDTYFSSDAWIRPTVLSFQVAFLTTVFALPLGLAASLAMVRTNFPGKAVLFGFLMSPMIVPVIILAIALYFAFAPLHLVGTVTGLVLAHIVLALPFVLIMLTGALQAIDQNFERAARSLGAGPVKAFILITLPMIMPAVITASFFAFLASFDEVVIALFLTGPGTTTLPRQLWEGVRFDLKPTIAAVSTLLILLSIILLLVSESVRSRLGRMR